MFILVLTYAIFAKLMIISQCAPKLGPVLFDPLKLDIIDPIVELPLPIAAAMLRSESKPEEETVRPCQGYNYDENICKLINNRILCGYNKNVGEINNKELDMGNGCHMKGDRIECGYKKKPFQGIRRPPPLASKETMRYSPTRTPVESIIMKLKAVALTATPTENPPIIKLKAILSDATSSKVSNENLNDLEATDTTTRVYHTQTVKTLNSIISTTPNLSNDSLVPTVKPRSITNDTSIASNDSRISSEFLEVDSKTDENIDSKTSMKDEKAASEFTLSKSKLTTESASKFEETTVNIDEKAVSEFTLLKSEMTTESSSKFEETTVNKIRIKKRNASWNKSKQPVNLCVEKNDRIVCYDHHFPNSG